MCPAYPSLHTLPLCGEKLYPFQLSAERLPGSTLLIDLLGCFREATIIPGSLVSFLCQVGWDDVLCQAVVKN